jgi:hypothetical protein
MNCEEVRIHLIDYLDKTLDTPTTTRVATHLISCAPCGAEASDLADCMHQVAALPPLDPPLGFTQRVMAHVREIEVRPALWERMFLPWSNWTKWMPLQATALVMVGIIGIVLYQKDDQLKPTESTNRTLSASIEPGNASNESNLVDTSPTDKKKEAALPAPVTLAKRAEPAPEKKSLSSPTSAQSPGAKSEVEARPEETKIPRRRPIQAQEAINPMEQGRFSGDAGFAPPMPLGGLRQAAPRSDRVIPLGERVADYEYVVRRRPSLRRDLADSMDTDSKLKSSEADSAARPAAPAPAAPRIESIAEIRFYNVAPEHFDYFKKELASEAIIEAESKSPATKEKEVAGFDRLLLIKVTILPPALPEPTAPPR